MVTSAVIKHMTKETWGGKGLFSLYYHITICHQRKSGQELKQGRNLEAGADAETMEGCCLLACSCGLLICFLIEPRTTIPGMAPPTIDWALPY
ncbi:rCG25260 [Rattus norvegicus]|uniref:RCG25260 n=1 Tax=Rattus norvegicus TaxID=10116 RepID=A6I2G8_RAT|nr:rCG25260 [Rattus norvegicus]